MTEFQRILWMWKLLRCSAVAACGLLVAPNTEGHVPIPVELEQLAREAESVVVGRVVTLESRFNDEGTMILTRATLKVEEVIVGAAAGSIQIVEYGGRVGNLVMSSPAQVVYERGEQLLIFVCRDALGLPRTCGAHQGRMSVRLSGDGTLEAHGVMAGRDVDGHVSDLRARILRAREKSQ